MREEINFLHVVVACSIECFHDLESACEGEEGNVIYCGEYLQSHDPRA